MIEKGTEQIPECMTIQSRLSDIAPVSVWLDALALRHVIPKNIQFAMNLCLEEALSNIIRHGYDGADDRSIWVRFSRPDPSKFILTIDDEAPRFNPLELPEIEPNGRVGEIQVGGQGVRLIRAFADAVEYEPTASGNRLRMSFSSTSADRTIRN